MQPASHRPGEGDPQVVVLNLLHDAHRDSALLDSVPLNVHGIAIKLSSQNAPKHNPHPPLALELVWYPFSTLEEPFSDFR